MQEIVEAWELVGGLNLLSEWLLPIYFVEYRNIKFEELHAIASPGP